VEEERETTPLPNIPTTTHEGEESGKAESNSSTTFKIPETSCRGKEVRASLTPLEIVGGKRIPADSTFAAGESLRNEGWPPVVGSQRKGMGNPPCQSVRQETKGLLGGGKKSCFQSHLGETLTRGLLKELERGNRARRCSLLALSYTASFTIHVLKRKG